jgi:hypothetical protein
MNPEPVICVHCAKSGGNKSSKILWMDGWNFDPEPVCPECQSKPAENGLEPIILGVSEGFQKGDLYARIVHGRAK